MHRIEWTTLLFFAAMFVTLECLERLGLVHWFSEHTINLISASDNENTQLATAIIVLVWVSGNLILPIQTASIINDNELN